MIPSDSIGNLSLIVDRFTDKQAHLRTEELYAYKWAGRKYASHPWVNHQRKEHSRGDIHNNTAESANAMVEWTRQGNFF